MHALSMVSLTLTHSSFPDLFKIQNNDPVQKYLYSYSILKASLLDVIYLTRPSTLAFIFGSISNPIIIYSLHSTCLNTSLQEHFMQLLFTTVNVNDTGKFTVLVWANRGIESDLLAPKKFRFKDPIDLGESVWIDDPDYVWYAINATLEVLNNDLI